MSQVEGIAWVINQLASKFPDLCVLFDGFSIPHGCSESYVADLHGVILQQKKAVSEIRSLVKPQVECRDIVGTTIHESIVWSYAIDAYVCHHGSIQHKVGWIANKPGVIHTNEKSAGVGKNHSTFWARENAVCPMIVTGADSNRPTNQSVSDARKNLQNYECDWAEVLDALQRCIDNRAQYGAGEPHCRPEIRAKE